MKNSISHTLSEYNRSVFSSPHLNLKESRLKRVFKMISKETPGKLLDIGCGSGDFSSIFIEEGWHVWGIDLDQGQLEEASKKGLDTTACDISRGLPFKDSFFICIFAGEIIEHLVDTDFFIKEMFRVTEKGGFAIITTPNLASFENRMRIFFGFYPVWVNYSLDGSGHVRAYTPGVLKKQIYRHGFIIEEHTGNWVPFIPQKFIDDVKFPPLAATGKLFPNLSMDIIIKARKAGE